MTRREYTAPVPTLVPHPSHTVREELEARHWTLDHLATVMTDPREMREWGINRLALDFFMEIGAMIPCMRMGAMAAQLDRAFGVSEGFFARLEAAWLKSVEQYEATVIGTADRSTQRSER